MVNGIRRVSNGVRKVSNGICGVSNGIHKVTNFQHNWFTISVRKISKRNKFEELKKKKKKSNFHVLSKETEHGNILTYLY